MLHELLRDYDNTWTMEGIIDKVRKLEKCTVIAHDFAPYSANSIYRRSGNTRGRTRGRGDRGGRGRGANFNTPPTPLSEITCFRCDKKGHYSNDCKVDEKNLYC